MNQLYKVVGLSKQAVCQYQKRQLRFDDKVRQLISEAEDLRKDHPGCGIEKMYYTLEPDFIGRDRFIELFTNLGFRIKRKCNYRRTTYASPSNYPNLIKGMGVAAPSIIWQSDITYFQVGDRFYYGVFIIDVYSKIIVGYQVSDNMRATANIKAFNMACKSHRPPKIHHSDRGSQYTYSEYLQLLKDKHCEISMAQSAQDNAYAERINNTIKNEYLHYWRPQTFEQLKRMVDKAVMNYNTKRIHNNLSRASPESFIKKWESTEATNKQKMTIFNNEI